MIIISGITFYLAVGFFLSFIHTYAMTKEDTLAEFLGMMLVWLPVWVIKASFGSVRLLVRAVSGD